MKPIAVEAKKTFSHGFVLTEAELRRLLDLMETQFEKLEGGSPLSLRFTLKFKNGVVAETSNIDDVIGQENVGSGRILRLGISYADQEGDDIPRAKIEFINADEDEEQGYTAIRYTLRANDRDWVFVTSSLLSERIDKVKRFAPNQLASDGRRQPALGLLPALVVLAVLASLLFAMYTRLAETAREDAENPLSAKLQSLVDEGKITDALEALILIQQNQEQRHRSLNLPEVFSPLFFVLGGLVALILALAAAMLFMQRYFSLYNFVWGDFEAQFQRREEARKFWIVIIGAGILVSAVGGLIANRLNFL